jgi:uncharacterized protein
MSEPFELAMFPLESALVPGEDLPLRIFEPRYQALVADCMRSPEPRFGVVLIAQGREVGGGDARSEVGVLTGITECAELGSGRYGLVCRAGERIRVSDWLPDDPYPRATVHRWPDEPGDPVSVEQILEVEDRVMALFERISCRAATCCSAPTAIPATHQGGCTRWHLACRSARRTNTRCCRRRRPRTGWLRSARRSSRSPR